MQNRRTISIVDDDDASREALAGLVRALGFEVMEFRDAFEFLTSEDRMSTSCLITDYRMPRLSGVELHRRLVDEGLTIPSVLVSAYSDHVARDRIGDAGIDWFLPKPVDPKELLRCLEAACGRRNFGNDGFQ
ncbi:response regulator transcription factor [Flaviflagellibacter deserti]|uniref:Response regulator transcription factor n=1 Tax=Flaviflagellibacter deserti TaxID=2267266 RepID=A0ABV9Z0P4_9HYPH